MLAQNTSSINCKESSRVAAMSNKNQIPINCQKSPVYHWSFIPLIADECPANIKIWPHVGPTSAFMGKVWERVEDGLPIIFPTNINGIGWASHTLPGIFVIFRCTIHILTLFSGSLILCPIYSLESTWASHLSVFNKIREVARASLLIPNT